MTRAPIALAMPLVLALPLALTGCGEGPPPEANALADARANTIATAASGRQATGTTAPGGGLTAQVSTVSADVSDLDTRITDLGLVIDLPADALFEFDRADLTGAAEAELRKAADVIRSAPPGVVRVIGHTDSRGQDAYNMRLSEARAQTVRDWFGQQVGVRQRTFETSGRGAAAPIAPNARADGSDDPAGRARNRRVEVIVPNTAAPAG